MMASCCHAKKTAAPGCLAADEVLGSSASIVELGCVQEEELAALAAPVPHVSGVALGINLGAEGH